MFHCPSCYRCVEGINILNLLQGQVLALKEFTDNVLKCCGALGALSCLVRVYFEYQVVINSKLFKVCIQINVILHFQSSNYLIPISFISFLNQFLSFAIGVGTWEQYSYWYLTKP